MFVKFLPFSFHVKDFSTRAILMQGTTKDGVYEWLHTSSDLKLVITFFSLRVFVDQWHHHLEHPSSQVLSHLISHQSLPMSSSTMYKFNCTLVIAIRLINCHFLSHLFTNSHPQMCGPLLLFPIMATNIMSFLWVISVVIRGFIISNKNQSFMIFIISLRPW